MKEIKTYKSSVIFIFNKYILNSLLILIVILSSCDDLPSDKAFDHEYGKSAIRILSDMYPEKSFELLSENKNSIVFYADDKLIRIEKRSDVVFFVHTENLEFFVKYGENIFDIYESSINKKNLDTDIIKIFDSDMNRVDDLEKFISHQIRFLASDDSECTVDSVVECIEIHCKDAGAILCAGCLLNKYCLSALTVWCAVDVIFEQSNPLYCD
jgi:hypothetical protein